MGVDDGSMQLPRIIVALTIKRKLNRVSIRYKTSLTISVCESNCEELRRWDFQGCLSSGHVAWRQDGEQTDLSKRCVSGLSLSLLSQCVFIVGGIFSTKIGSETFFQFTLHPRLLR